MRRTERTASLFIIAAILAIALYLALARLPSARIAAVDVDPAPSLERIFLPLAGTSYFSSRRFQAELAASRLPYIGSVSLAFDGGRACIGTEYREDGVLLASADGSYISYPGSFVPVEADDIPFLMGIYPLVEGEEGFLADPWREDVLAAARSLSGLSSLITWMKYGNNNPDGSPALTIDIPALGAVLSVTEDVSGDTIRKGIDAIGKGKAGFGQDAVRYRLLPDGTVMAEGE